MLKYYLLEKNSYIVYRIYIVMFVNIYFQKKQGQSWTNKSPNESVSKIDYIIINIKWKNSVKNCRAYNSFISIASDHRIISVNIKLCLSDNNKNLVK